MSKQKRQKEEGCTRYDRGKLTWYLDDVLPPLLERELEAHIHQCPDCFKRYSRMRKPEPWILGQLQLLRPKEVPDFPFGELYVQLEEDTTESKPTRIESAKMLVLWRWGFLVSLLLGFSCILLHSQAQRPWQFTSSKKTQLIFPQSLSSKESHIQPKGWSAELLFAHRQGTAKFPKTQRVKDGQLLYPNDIIQFRYEFSQKREVMLAGCNDNGQVFSLRPVQQLHSFTQQAGEGTFPNKRSFFLDGYIGKEYYFLVVSYQRFSWPHLKMLLKESCSHPNPIHNLQSFPKSWEVRSWRIIKKPRLK